MAAQREAASRFRGMESRIRDGGGHRPDVFRNTKDIFRNESDIFRDIAEKLLPASCADSADSAAERRRTRHHTKTEEPWRQKTRNTTGKKTSNS